VPELSNVSIPSEPDYLEHLAELALDLRNCWNHTTHALWSAIDPELWEITQNPWVVLQTASRSKLEALQTDPEFGRQIRELVEWQRQHLKSPAWFQHAYSTSPLTCVAYFSMEFGLSEALPIYSGGLGNVAGDYLKAGSTWGCRLSAWGCSISKAIFARS